MSTRETVGADPYLQYTNMLPGLKTTNRQRQQLQLTDSSVCQRHFICSYLYAVRFCILFLFFSFFSGGGGGGVGVTIPRAPWVQNPCCRTWAVQEIWIFHHGVFFGFMFMYQHAVNKLCYSTLGLWIVICLRGKVLLRMVNSCCGHCCSRVAI